MTGLVLVAAGSGQRLAAGVPKALVQIGGRTMIGHCLRTAGEVARIRQVVIVAPAEEVLTVAEDPAAAGMIVVAGGTSRDASVRAGLAALAEDIEVVLVHDAARPFTPPEVFERVLDALRTADAVIPAVPVADTIKRVRHAIVVGTPARDELVAVQTPQGFRRAVLESAHAGRGGDVTDDAMLVEQAGVPVHVVAGSPRSFKVTSPFDLMVARAMQEDLC